MSTQSIDSLLARLNKFTGRGVLIGKDADSVKEIWGEIESRVGGQEEALVQYGTALPLHFREILGIKKAA